LHRESKGFTFMTVAVLEDLTAKLGLRKVCGYLWRKTEYLSQEGKPVRTVETEMSMNLSKIGGEREKLLAILPYLDTNWPNMARISDQKMKPIEGQAVNGLQLYEFKRFQHRLVYFMKGKNLYFCHYCRKKNDRWLDGKEGKFRIEA
jgi:hypothetical protein